MSLLGKLGCWEIYCQGTSFPFQFLLFQFHMCAQSRAAIRSCSPALTSTSPRHCPCSLHGAKGNCRLVFQPLEERKGSQQALQGSFIALFVIFSSLQDFPWPVSFAQELIPEEAGTRQGPGMLWQAPVGHCWALQLHFPPSPGDIKQLPVGLESLKMSEEWKNGK